MPGRQRSQKRRGDLGPADRTVAAILATVWLAGGLTALVLGLVQDRLLGFVLAVPAIVYGVLWLRAALIGRRLRWPVNRS
jgi:cell shape-determining protein MreD